MAEPNEVDQLLDQMLKGKTREEVLGKDGVLKGLTKRLVEPILEGELTSHLGDENHAAEGRKTGNSRNGTTAKSVLTGAGEFEIEVPRDRNREFEPQLVKVDGLKGFPDAIEHQYPAAQAQLCIVRNLLRYVSWKDRKLIAALNHFSMVLPGRVPNR